ncbi:MAG: hypothetical protein H6811_06685 [Phycisphaeraceae bacterium]|nr:hypothetical protein [Phycisphaeraceae bacterium]
MTTSPTVFEPSPDTAEQLLHDLGNPHDSLAAIALHYGTSLDGLAAWMARPDVAPRIADIESAAAQRARLAALLQLPKTVATLMDMIDGYRHQETHDPIRNDLKQCRARETQRANARKAIHLLRSIASFSAAPRSATRVHAPTTHRAASADSPASEAPRSVAPAQQLTLARSLSAPNTARISAQSSGDPAAVATAHPRETPPGPREAPPSRNGHGPRPRLSIAAAPDAAPHAPDQPDPR